LSRVALVTGAATGIGRATADELERRGYTVARNHLPGQTVDGHSAPADVSDPAQVNAMVAAIGAELGPVEVLVANAADMVMGAIDEVPEPAFWSVVHTNLGGAFACVRACLPGMLARRFGRIVHVTSEWGQIGWPRATAYSASKAGLISLTKALARELGPAGITVNAVAPGVIDTPQLEVDAADAGVPLAELRTRYAAAVPMGRIGQPAEVATAIAHLVADSAATLTGQVLAVNGGTTR
jgi:NAD(P)-dependent dehydrogenase (short-subunit alcohol dehydrogenase family)